MKISLYSMFFGAALATYEVPKVQSADMTANVSPRVIMIPPLNDIERRREQRLHDRWQQEQKMRWHQEDYNDWKYRIQKEK